MTPNSAQPVMKSPTRCGGKSAYPRFDSQKKIAGYKRCHISEPVPSRSDVVVDPENDWIEIVKIVREHLRRDCARRYETAQSNCSHFATRNVRVARRAAATEDESCSKLFAK